MSDETINPQAEEPTPDPSTMTNPAPAEVPASEPVVVVEAPADAARTDGQQTTVASPAPVETAAAPVSAPDAVQAEVANVAQAAESTVAAAAEAAAPVVHSVESLMQELADTKSRLEQTVDENNGLKEQITHLLNAAAPLVDPVEHFVAHLAERVKALL